MSCLQSGLVVVVKSPCLAALFHSEKSSTRSLQSRAQSATCEVIGKTLIKAL